MSTQPNPQSVAASKTAAIRALNDQLRRTSRGGRIMCTVGVNALGTAAVVRILRAIAAFENFSPDNDPHGEHDFGAIEAEGARIFWKIDYYDPSLTRHSHDPADPKVTERVMTVMLAEEY